MSNLFLWLLWLPPNPRNLNIFWPTFDRKCQLHYANNFSIHVYIRYCHTLKWLCLGRLVVTSLKDYLQMHLMFLSNDSHKEPLHVGVY